MSRPDPHVYSLSEAAEVLGVTRQTLSGCLDRSACVLRFVGGRTLPVYSFGGHRWFVPKAALERFLSERDEEA